MDANESSKIREQKQEVTGIFNRAAPTYDQVGPRQFSYFGRRLVELAQIPVGAHVLDIATGQGAVLFPAADAIGAQGHIIGIDLAQEMLGRTREKIQELNLQNVEVREMDAEYLEFPDNSFDFVLCSFAIFFFPQLDRALSEMRRVLKPRGRIVVSTWAESLVRQWKWFDDLIETYLDSKEETKQTVDSQSTPKPAFGKLEGLETILKSAGFENIEVTKESKDLIYTDEEEWWASIWSHGLREGLEAVEAQTGIEGLQKLKADVFQKLREIKQPDGIHQLFSVLFGFASKPQIL